MEGTDQKAIKLVMNGMQDLFITCFNKAVNKKMIKKEKNDEQFNINRNNKYSVYNFINVGNRKQPYIQQYNDQQIKAFQGKKFESRIFTQSYHFFQDYKKSNLVRSKYFCRIFPQNRANQRNIQSILNSALNCHTIQQIFKQFTPLKFRQAQIEKLLNNILSGVKLNSRLQTSQIYLDVLQQGYYRFDHQVRQIELKKRSKHIVKNLMSDYIVNLVNQSKQSLQIDLRMQRRQQLVEIYFMLLNDHILSGIIQLPSTRKNWPENFRIEAQLKSLCSLASNKLLHKVCDLSAKLRKQRHTINYVTQVFPNRSNLYWKKIYQRQNKVEQRPQNFNISNKKIEYQKQMPENVIKICRKSIQHQIFSSPSNKNVRNYKNPIYQVEIIPQHFKQINKKTLQQKCNKNYFIPQKRGVRPRQNQVSSSSILLQNYIRQRQSRASIALKQPSHNHQETAKKSKRVDKTIDDRFESYRKKITKASKTVSKNKFNNEVHNRIEYQGNNNQLVKLKDFSVYTIEHLPVLQKYQNQPFVNDIKQKQNSKQSRQTGKYAHFHQNNFVLNKGQICKDIQWTDINANTQNKIKQNSQMISAKAEPRIKQRNKNYLIQFPYKIGPLVVQSQEVSYLSYDIQDIDLVNLAAKFLSDREKYGQNDVNLMIQPDTEQNIESRQKVFRAMDIIDYMGGFCIIKQKKYYRKFHNQNSNKIFIAAFLLNLPLAECIKFLGIRSHQSR